jgi:hypothetical protein
MEVPMTNKSDDNRNSDIELLASWREWLTALDAEMSATNERDEKRRHVRVAAIQHSITETPSEGLAGIGVKLALAIFSMASTRAESLRYPHIWTQSEC